MRIRYVLLKSIGQFVAPVRVSLTLISQNAGIYSVLLSSISLFVAPVRVSLTLISQNAGIYSGLAGRLVRKRCFSLPGGFERIPEGFLKGLQGVF